LPEPFTPEELERVQNAAYHLAMLAPKLVGDQALFPTAALTMAACHAAILSDISFEDLMLLFKLHYESALVGLAARAAEEAGEVAMCTKPPEGKS